MPRTARTRKASTARVAEKKKKVIKTTPRKKKVAVKRKIGTPKTTRKKSQRATSRKGTQKAKQKAVKKASISKKVGVTTTKKKGAKTKKATGVDKKDKEKERKEGDTYHVRHKSHVVKVERLLLSDALAQGNMDGWSEARKRAYQLKDHNPNAYYYRFNDPGEAQGSGAWSKDEVKQFLKRNLESYHNLY